VDPRGESTALASLSGSITILNSELKQSAILPGHSLACRDLSWGTAGLVSCGFDKTVRIRSIPKATCQVFETNGLAHSVCGKDSDPNVLFSASGDQIFWIDKRRQTPITVPAGTHARAVTASKDFLLFGGYSGILTLINRRSLQSGPIATVELSGGPVSSLSKVRGSKLCVAVSAWNSPQILELNETIGQHELHTEPPGRFGCRADITEKGLYFDGDFATVCGGKRVTFIDGVSNTCPQLFESVGGFQYEEVLNMGHFS
jgi:WD40 repeat protein